MAARKPLYWDTATGSMKTMTTSQVNSIIDQVSYLYSLNPSVTLSVVGSGGSLGTISDTRTSAGASITRADRYATEAETAEPGIVTVNYSKINESVASVSAPTRPDNASYPVYWSNGIRAFNATDMYDTFIYPAIDNLALGSTGVAQGGTYRIHTSTSLTDHTLVSSTPVFSDTRANTALYTAAGIGEALDQPFTVTDFYLFRVNGGSYTNYVQPLRITASDTNLQTYTRSTLDSILTGFVRYAATSVSGYTLRYNINGSGNNRGTAMTNTKLNGAGNYQTRFVNADDYRAQEFPNGTAVIDNTYNLRISKV